MLTHEMHRVVQHQVLAALAKDDLLHLLAELEPLLLHGELTEVTSFKGLLEKFE